MAWADLGRGGDGLQNIAEFLRPPFFMSGDPRREWHFTFMLAASQYAKNASAIATSILSQVVLLYVSGLAEKVTIPSSKFTFTQTQFSTLQVPFPKGFELPSLQVQYLEDDLGLVSLFHRIWQSSIKGHFKTSTIKVGETVMDNGDGVVFEELGKVCAMALYSPARMTGGEPGEDGVGGVRLEVPLPTGLEVWPAIFPVEIASDPANRGGNNLAKVTVTYARIPVWSMRGNIYEWTPPDKGEGFNPISEGSKTSVQGKIEKKVVVSGDWGLGGSNVD
jgi:hypothetical protein